MTYVDVYMYADTCVHAEVSVSIHLLGLGMYRNVCLYICICMPCASGVALADVDAREAEDLVHA